jgi:hypothetical protein
MSWNLSARLNNLQRQVDSISNTGLTNPLQQILNANKYSITGAGSISSDPTLPLTLAGNSTGGIILNNKTSVPLLTVGTAGATTNNLTVNGNATFTGTITAAGGGIGVESVSVGTGIAISGNNSNPVLTNSGEVKQITGGTGCDVVTTSTQKIINNTGVLAVTAGPNISVSGTPSNPVINCVIPDAFSVNGGQGITVAEGSNYWMVNNTGINTLTVGNGLTSTGGSFPVIKSKLSNYDWALGTNMQEIEGVFTSLGATKNFTYSNLSSNFNCVLSLIFTPSPQGFFGYGYGMSMLPLRTAAPPSGSGDEYYIDYGVYFTGTTWAIITNGAIGAVSSVMPTYPCLYKQIYNDDLNTMTIYFNDVIVYTIPNVPSNVGVTYCGSIGGSTTGSCNMLNFSLLGSVDAVLGVSAGAGITITGNNTNRIISSTGVAATPTIAQVLTAGSNAGGATIAGLTTTSTKFMILNEGSSLMQMVSGPNNTINITNGTATNGTLYDSFYNKPPSNYITTQSTYPFQSTDNLLYTQTIITFVEGQYNPATTGVYLLNYKFNISAGSTSPASVTFVNGTDAVNVYLKCITDNNYVSIATLAAIQNTSIIGDSSNYSITALTVLTTGKIYQLAYNVENKSGTVSWDLNSTTLGITVARLC